MEFGDILVFNQLLNKEFMDVIQSSDFSTHTVTALWTLAKLSVRLRPAAELILNCTSLKLKFRKYLALSALIVGLHRVNTLARLAP